MSSKVGIVSTCNLKYAPYIKLYTTVLDKAGIKYDLIIWDKYDLNEQVAYSYHGKKNDGDKIKSFFQYIGFGRFLDKILYENRYERLIVCNPAPLLFIRKKTLEIYKERFIWDIRDDSPIRKYFYRKFKKIRSNAAMVVTSSRRYDQWIGEPTVLSHNAEKRMILNSLDYMPHRKNCGRVRIINAGKMIEESENIEVLKRMGNDSRYEFIYYGREVPGKVKLMDFCRENNIENVTFLGTYNKGEIIDIYRNQGDLINILRANTTINRDALPNKLYEAVIAGVPLVVFEHNTVISDYAKKYYLGIVLRDESELGSLVSMLDDFDFERYADGRKKFLEQIVNDIDLFEERVKKFCM